MSEDIKSKIDEAFSFHKKGDFDIAKKMYLDILEIEPNNSNVLSLLGKLELKQNNPKSAINYLLKSANENPHFDTFFSLANAFMQVKDSENAITAYDFAIQLKPDFYEAIFNVGNIYNSLGNYEKAVEYYQKAYNINPNDIDLNKLLASSYFELKNYAKSIEFYKNAYKINSYDSSISYNLGILYQKINDYKNSVEILEKLLLYDKNVDIYITLANSYNLQENKQKAIEILEEALSQKQKIDIICVNIATFYYENDTKKAKEYYEKALAYNADNLEAMNGLGLCYFNENNFDKAKECYEKVLSIEPNYLRTIQNMGILQKYLHNHETSKKCFEKIIDIEPDNIDAHISLGMALLSEKDFKNGYKHYIYRHLNKKHFLPSEFIDKKEYVNQDLENKTIIVDSDGGHGDTIQFCRYLPFLAKKTKKVILRTHFNMLELMKSNFPMVEVITKEDTTPDFDYFTHIIDLPYLLNMDFNSIPFADGYLKVSNDLIKDFSQKDYFQTDKKKIALFWQGNVRGMKNRAVSLEKLYPLKNIPNARFYSLQKGLGEEQIKYAPKDFDIVNLNSEIKTFSDSAAIIKNVDYVITIDSVTVHLAGALGKQTFLMLPYTSEWRWFSDNEKTSWYDSVRIIKQTSHNNWQGITENLLKITPNL